jgi:hypothetical protein
MAPPSPEPWTATGRRPPATYQPIWQPLPWYLRNPFIAALLGGTTFAILLWAI